MSYKDKVILQHNTSNIPKNIIAEPESSRYAILYNTHTTDIEQATASLLKMLDGPIEGIRWLANSCSFSVSLGSSFKQKVKHTSSQDNKYMLVPAHNCMPLRTPPQVMRCKLLVSTGTFLMLKQCIQGCSKARAHLEDSMKIQGIPMNEFLDHLLHVRPLLRNITQSRSSLPVILTMKNGFWHQLIGQMSFFSTSPKLEDRFTIGTIFHPYIDMRDISDQLVSKTEK